MPCSRSMCSWFGMSWDRYGQSPSEYASLSDATSSEVLRLSLFSCCCSLVNMHGTASRYHGYFLLFRTNPQNIDLHLLALLSLLYFWNHAGLLHKSQKSIRGSAPSDCSSPSLVSETITGIDASVSNPEAKPSGSPAQSNGTRGSSQGSLGSVRFALAWA